MNTRFKKGNKEGKKQIGTPKPGTSRYQKIMMWKRRVKDGKIDERDVQRICDQLEDPDALSLDMLELLNEMKDSSLMTDPDLRLKTIRMYNDVAKTLHGEKIKVQSTNINLTPSQEVSDEIMRKMME